MSVFEKFGDLDRRWIYLAIGLSVIIPLIFNLVFPTVTTPIVQNIFDAVDALPAGSKVMLTADYGPSTTPENQPMFEAVARHCLEKKLRLYALTIWVS